MISLIFTTIGKAKPSYIEDALAQMTKLPTEVVSEIIVVDNSLNPEFHDFLKKRFKAHSLQVKYINNSEKIKMGENWNTAFSQVSNEWVLFHHDDDILIPESFQKLVELLDDKFGFFSFDYIVLDNSGSKSLIKLQDGLENIIECTPKYISTIFNTKKLNAIGNWEDKYGYFLDFVGILKLAAKFGSRHISLPLGYYRIHGENASSREKRAKGYGDYLPKVLNDLYPLFDNDQLKRKLTFHLASYSYPHQTLFKRFCSKLFGLLGFKIWFQ